MTQVNGFINFTFYLFKFSHVLIELYHLFILACFTNPGQISMDFINTFTVILNISIFSYIFKCLEYAIPLFFYFIHHCYLKFSHCLLINSDIIFYIIDNLIQKQCVDGKLFHVIFL